MINVKNICEIIESTTEEETDVDAVKKHLNVSLIKRPERQTPPPLLPSAVSLSNDDLNVTLLLGNLLQGKIKIT
jgi:hypothetical protein